MEKNINLAKILNGKPVNTKLWSPLFGDVYTSSICSEDTIIVVNHHAESSSFYNNGKYFNHAEAELLLFPSKEMRDWSKFAWKKGDILVKELRESSNLSVQKTCFCCGHKFQPEDFISLACFDKGMGNKFLCQKCKDIALKDLGDKNIYLH